MCSLNPSRETKIYGFAVIPSKPLKLICCCHSYGVWAKLDMVVVATAVENVAAVVVVGVASWLL